MGETDRIRKWLANHEPHGKWGFVIYRCTYGDDARWARFMDILNARVRQSLEFEGALDLMNSLDWTVQEDLTLQDASKDEVRNRFRSWISTQIYHTLGFTPRYQQCITVDETCLRSVLNGPQPPAQDDWRGKGYVHLVDLQFSPSDEYEDEPPIDGCCLKDVGWMKVGLQYIAPRTYNLMGGSGWQGNYRRPPAVALP